MGKVGGLLLLLDSARPVARLVHLCLFHLTAWSPLYIAGAFCLVL